MAFSGSTHIAAIGPVLCKVGMGQLVSVAVNRAGANGNSLVLYDSASVAGVAQSKVLANIDLVNLPKGPLLYNVIVANGLVADMENGTPGDVTVAWD